MFCPSCGGEYADWAHKCPYCGNVNENVDEELYLAHLEEVRKRLDVVDEESEEAYKIDVKTTVKDTVRVVVTLLVIVTVAVIALFAWQKKKEIGQEHRMQEQYEWEKEEFPKLDAWMEEENYDAIIDEYYNVILNTDYSMFDWPHYYYVCESYNRYKDIQKAKDLLEKGEEVPSYIMGGAIYSGLKMKYEWTDEYLERLVDSYKQNGQYGLTQEEYEKTLQFREAGERFLKDGLHWSDDEVEEYYGKCSKKGYIGIDACYDLADELSHQDALQN